MYELRKNYRQEDTLRKSFNELAKTTFGLEFEDWYQNGYWTDCYNPYSIVIDHKVVSNVSVNTMEFLYQGEHKTYIQLGTVMTDKQYRNQGLTKIIMQAIEHDYKEKVDGFYLFANDSVLDYYPKFGYRKAIEYQYSKVLSNELGSKPICKQAKQIPMDGKKSWLLLEKTIDRSVSNSAFDMIHNKGLIMFYVTQFMQNDVYYVEEQDAYVIAEIKEEELFIHSTFSNKVVDIDNLVRAFGDINKVVLGFTPITRKGYVMEELREENTTLFVQGRGFDLYDEKGIRFPSLSHA